jgi:hypothetical protein
MRQVSFWISGALRLLGLAFAVSICTAMVGQNAWGFSPFGDEGDFQLGQWRGGLEAGYEWEDQRTDSPGSHLDLLRNRLDEDVNLRNEGYYLIDPRLIQGMAGVNLDFFQESDQTAGTTQRYDGTQIGYNITTEFLPEEAYTGAFSANRSDDTTSTPYGGQTETVATNLGVTAQLRDYSDLRKLLPYFTARLDARQDEVNETTTQLGQTYKYDDQRDTVGLDAHKGFQTADLDLDYQFVRDSVSGTNNLSYDTQWLTADYSLDFGPSLNRHWISRINYYDIAGSFGQKLLYVNEQLHIDYFKNLSTTYQYDFSRTQSEGQTVMTNTGAFQLYYGLFRSLGTTVDLQGMYETLPGGYVDFYAAGLGHTYTRTIPWGGNLYLGLLNRYQMNDDHLPSGTIQVIDEQHTATPTGFTLDNPFVVTSTIAVFDVQSGSRIPTTKGVDYNIVAQGNLTQIVILPTSLIIHPGDALDINYQYQTQPSASFSITTTSANAGVSFSWFDLAFDYERDRQHLESGQAAQFFLYNLTSETAAADAHGDWEWFGTRVGARYQNYDQTFTKYTSEDVNEYSYLRPGWNVRLGLMADAMYTEYKNPSRHTTTFDGEFTADRYATLGNYISLYARVLRIMDSELPTENDTEVGLRAHWQYGKLYAEPTLSWAYRTWGTVTVNDPHIIIRIGRYL